MKYLFLAIFLCASTMGDCAVPDVTFSVSNSRVEHQVTIERHGTRTIGAIIDGIQFEMTDATARRDGKAIQGGGITVQIFQTTLTVTQAGYVTFSGIISSSASEKIIEFILACHLPPITL